MTLSLTHEERKVLITYRDQNRDRRQVRALAILDLDAGRTVTDIVTRYQVNRRTVTNWRTQWSERRLEFLEDAPRSGRPSCLSGRQRAKVTALACFVPSTSPYRRSFPWIATQAMALEICAQLSEQTTRNILQRNGLRPEKQTQWHQKALEPDLFRRIDAVFDEYALPYDPDVPVLYFDEQTFCRTTSTLFVAVEPRTGRRIAQIGPRRTQQDYTDFCQIIRSSYPDARTIRVVQDNMSAHDLGEEIGIQNLAPSDCLAFFASRQRNQRDGRTMK